MSSWRQAGLNIASYLGDVVVDDATTDITGAAVLVLVEAEVVIIAVAATAVSAVADASPPGAAGVEADAESRGGGTVGGTTASA